jgi:hypothetical protein
VRLALVVCAAVAAIAVSTVGAGAAPARACASIRARGEAYRVTVTPALTCVAGRRALTTFIARAVRPRGWACFRGHGGDRWAAACSRTGLGPVRIARAYLIR